MLWSQASALEDLDEGAKKEAMTDDVPSESGACAAGSSSYKRSSAAAFEVTLGIQCLIMVGFRCL